MNNPLSCHHFILTSYLIIIIAVSDLWQHPRFFCHSQKKCPRNKSRLIWSSFLPSEFHFSANPALWDKTTSFWDMKNSLSHERGSERSERASKRVSGASERANGRASGQYLHLGSLWIWPIVLTSIIPLLIPLLLSPSPTPSFPFSPPFPTPPLLLLLLLLYLLRKFLTLF